MKKITSIILTLIMLLTLAPIGTMAEVNFKDVNESDYYAVAAGKLSELKILEGYPDGTFGAQRAITRAEMAAIVCRMIDADMTKQNLKSTFTDVADNHWAIAYISAASEKKIINGDGDGTFRPEDDVKYEEALKMVVCALGLVDDDIEVDPVDWSAAYLKIADENKITENLIGRKGEKSTRGDIAVMVFNGIVPEIKAPTASLEEGTYTSSKKVTLKSDIEGAKIYYTTNGKTPTVESTEYTKEITISKTCTLKAIAVVDDAVSDVLTVEYKIKTSGGSSGGSNGKLDFEAPETGDNIGGSSGSDNSGNDSSDPGTGSKPVEPTPEEIEASEKVCADLRSTLEAVELIEFNGKAAEVIDYVKKDITLALEAADNGTLITNMFVRTTYADDIAAVKEIINSMDDNEKEEFKTEILKIDLYSLMALSEYFDINTEYFD